MITVHYYTNHHTGGLMADHIMVISVLWIPVFKRIETVRV